MMKINELVIAPAGLIGTIPVPFTNTRLWVPSDALRITSLTWPGHYHRYRIWQRLKTQLAFSGMFNFESYFDVTQQKTLVSVMQVKGDPWAGLPFSMEQVDRVTAPNIMAQRFLPQCDRPFVLLAYRWLGRVELCAYHHGLLRHTDRAEIHSPGLLALCSRMVQFMPVLSSAPLYCLESQLTEWFQSHHAPCHTLAARRTPLALFFQRMRQAQHEFES